jgi:Invasion associated locus B (IalB) protein
MKLLIRTIMVAALVSISGIGMAQSVQVLGDHRDWSSYSANDGSGIICFSTAKPDKTEPVPDGYDEARIYITHRPSQGIRNEFNLIAGYEFEPESMATLKIGGQTFDLFTQLDSAWLKDLSQASALVSAIRSGATLIVEGVSANGIKIAQTFSLSGSTAASRSIDAAC